MDLKRVILFISVILIFVSILGVCASDYQQNIDDIKLMLETTDASELTGCCSVVLQENGNNSMFAFRRDAGNQADIFIEKVNWFGHNATKQYKTSAGYFCQVVVTEDGWVFGFGGIDDGDDNKKIENIASKMLNNNSSISEDYLTQIQHIKAAYGLGHFLIKAPNGNYGIATATNQITGHLNPGEYVSIPNKFSFFRSGTVSLNTTDKVSTMAELAASDGFGLTRRDITTFDYDTISNATFNGSIIKMYLSNDDGSMYGMDTSGLADNVIFNNTTFHAEKIPIVPKYQYIGNVTFGGEEQGPQMQLGDSSYNILSAIYLKIAILLIFVLFIIALQAIYLFRHR